MIDVENIENRNVEVASAVNDINRTSSINNIFMKEYEIIKKEGIKKDSEFEKENRYDESKSDHCQRQYQRPEC